MLLVASHIGERAPEELRARLAAIVSSSEDAIVSKTLDGVITSWNLGAQRMFGYAPEEAVGRHITLLIPEERLAEEDDVLARLRRGERIEHFETVRQGKDGRRIDVSLSVSPIRDGDGRIVGASKIARDIGERKRAEALLACQKQAFEMFASGAQLIEVLEFLTGAVELQSRQGALMAIHLLDETGTRFVRTAAPSLPAAYRRAVQGMEVGSATGPCCAAVTRRARVAVPDVALDDEFPGFASFALPMGIRSGWSAPILSSPGVVLGTVASYYREPRCPDPQDDLLAEIVTRTAGIIVEREQAAEAVRRSQELFREMADTAPAIIWMSDAAGSCTFLSRGWYEYTGREPEPRPTGSWIDALGAAERSQAMELLANARHAPFTLDCRLRRNVGEYRWAMCAARPRFAEGGAFLGYVGTIVDIDDRKRAEEQLRKAEQASSFLALAGATLSTLSDRRSTFQKVARLAVPVFADWCAVDVLGEEGTLELLAVTHSDPAKVRLVEEMRLRHSLDPGAQRGPARAVRTGEPELVTEVSEAQLAEVGHDPQDLDILRSLGLRSYICVPLRVRRRPIGVLSFATSDSGRRYDDADLRVAEDLAERASIALENADLYRALQDSDRAKDEFLATVSHELRTPLNAIVGWAHILRAGTDAETARKAAEIINRNAQSQAQLLSDILDGSRIVAGKLRLETRPLDLADVVHAALDTVRPAADARGVRLETSLEDAAASIDGDPDRLQQILWNLLSNAIKFAPAQAGEVRLRLEGAESRVRVIVEDNGPGVDPAFLPHVFELFRQAESPTTRRHKGLGLGLAIVKRLVELHGGSVSAANRDGHSGAAFVVELPRRSTSSAARLPAIELRPRAEEALWLDAAPSLEDLSVLLVDDDSDAREMLQAVLERCGAQVSSAASARDGLAALRQRRPQVVVADIEMPEEDGYAFIRQVRALAPENGGLTPAAALTAYAGAQDRVRALRAHFHCLQAAAVRT